MEIVSLANKNLQIFITDLVKTYLLQRTTTLGKVLCSKLSVQTRRCLDLHIGVDECSICTLFRISPQIPMFRSSELLSTLRELFEPGRQKRWNFCSQWKWCWAPGLPHDTVVEVQVQQMQNAPLLTFSELKLQKSHLYIS